MPTENELDALYRKSWQSPSENGSETGNTSKLVAEQYYQLIEAAAGPIAEKTILDFGVGRGSLVGILDKASVNISSIEPYAGARRRWRATDDRASQNMNMRFVRHARR